MFAWLANLFRRRPRQETYPGPQPVAVPPQPPLLPLTVPQPPLYADWCTLGAAGNALPDDAIDCGSVAGEYCRRLRAAGYTASCVYLYLPARAGKGCPRHAIAVLSMPDGARLYADPLWERVAWNPETGWREYEHDAVYEGLVPERELRAGAEFRWPEGVPV